MKGNYYSNSILLGAKNQPDHFWKVQLDSISDNSTNQKVHIIDDVINFIHKVDDKILCF